MGSDRENELLQENKRLKKENEELKQLLHQHGIKIPQTKEAKLKERVNLFRSLFKGREGVFAYRWEIDGEVGYSPARKNGQLLLLTDQAVYDHLKGDKTLGIYPVLLDNTCWFLAVDFDKKNWKKDARAFIQTCNAFNVPASMEKSRSGNGCHVWIFFQEPVEARLARKLGNFLLAKSGGSKLDSYDRMFPNQDSVPQGKFGNLIALPLQGGPRKNGNSVFVDGNFQLYTNQWGYLSTVKKIQKTDIDAIVAGSQDDFVVKETPKQVEVMPRKVSIVYKNGIYISKANLPQKLLNELTQLAKFSNPEFYKAQRNRLSTKEIPRNIDCSEEKDDWVILPRGCTEALRDLLKEKSIEMEISDQSNTGNEIDAVFHGKLSILQEEVKQKMLAGQTGILTAATGFGKTVVAASLIAERKVNTLVIVHRKNLMEQWKARLASFLNLDERMIGQIGGGKYNAKGIVDIAMIQSLYQGETVKDYIKNYGLIIVDECHHIAAFKFEMVMKQAEAAYVHGMTATTKRKDGFDRIIRMQLGPVRYKISAKEMAKIRPFNHILVPKYTKFKSKQNDVQALYGELAKDAARNELIFNNVLSELEQGAAPIILTERIEHVRKLKTMFSGFSKNIIVLTGELGKKEERERLRKLNELSDDAERLVIATGKYIGEGFDNARLDTLFLAMPISWKGTLQQYVGRLHRLHEAKTTVKVYDYVDHHVPVFENMFSKRKKGYKALGYVDAESASGNISQQMHLF